MSNLKLAFRRLFKTPFVSAVAIVSLALGIGANAAIFSIFDQMLLRALPVQDPERLVNLSSPGPKQGSTSCGTAGDCSSVFSYPMFKDLERLQKTFTGLAAHVEFGANLAYRGQTLNGEGMFVSGSYFPVLGVRPALGRLFGYSDDRTVGSHFVTVLSHRYWTMRLGRNPAVLNDKLIVNGQPMTIVGVAPAGFQGTTLGIQPDVFVPMTMRGLLVLGWDGFSNRRSYWAYLFARLKPGVSIDQASAAMNAIYRPILHDVEAPLQKGMSDQTLARFKSRTITIEEGERGQSDVHTEAKVPLMLLLSVTGVVLLIACANIANLLLARSAARASEMAVRLSIGAGRWHLLRQLLTESCVLAALGGAFSLVVAHWTLRGVASLLPAEATDMIDFAVKPSVVLFSAIVAMATGVLFGIFPALHSTRPDLVTTLKAQAGQPSSARTAARFRTSLVTAQIALSLALLISAGLFVKSLSKVSRVDLGLNTDSIATFRISPQRNGYDTPRTRALFERLETELAALPGVASVSASMVPLLTGSNWGSSVSVQGFRADPDTDTESRYNEIGPGYFRTLGIPLISGREFTAADALGAAKVAIVNEAFAKKFNLGRDAVGKYMATDSGAGVKLDHQIVGLVTNAKYSDVKRPVPSQFFRPYRQRERLGTMSFYVRTSGDPERVLSTITGVMARLDPNLPLYGLKTMPQQVRENVFMDRMISTLTAAFGLLATLLAAVGLYGVLAYTVAQRTREIGLRMALGADAGRVRRMVLGQVARMAIIGGAIGIAAAIGLGKAAKSLLFEMEGHDPAVIVAASIALAVVALGAGFVPAQRASRVQPMQALRYE
jgi:predicted permease